MAGSLAKRPNGKWRARYRDETGRERSRHFDRKIDGQRWLDEIASSVLTGTYVDPDAGRITFQHFYDGWSQRQLWVPSTRSNADLATQSVTFGNLPLRSIRRSHVEEWIKAVDAQWAATTIKTRFVIVRSVFRAAVNDRVIAVDPCAGVVLPRRRKTEASMRVPTVDEVGRLLAHADSARVSTRKGFRAYVALCAFAGLRKGEAAAIRVGDIDLIGRRLAVARQLQRDGSTYVVRAPKYGSERTVYLPDDLVTILGDHIAGHVSDGEPDGWLFTVGDEPMYDNAITWRWRATRAAAQLARVRLHDLRHFYASGLIAAGCDVVTVQRALGHSTATTTLNTYSHLWPTAEDRTRTAAAGLMKQALTASAAAPPVAHRGARRSASPRILADSVRTDEDPQRSDLRKQGRSVVPGVRRPVGLALLEELVASLLCLVGHVRQSSGLAGEELLADQSVVEEVEGVLQHPLGGGALAVDLAAPLEGDLLELRVLDDPVDGTHGVHLVGGVLLGEEEDLAGELLADHLGEVRRAVTAVEGAHVGVGLLEPRVLLRGQRQVAHDVQ